MAGSYAPRRTAGDDAPASGRVHRYRRTGNRHTHPAVDLHRPPALRRGDDAGPGAVAAIHLHAERVGPVGAVPRHGTSWVGLRLHWRGGGRAAGRDPGLARRLEMVSARPGGAVAVCVVKTLPRRCCARLPRRPRRWGPASSLARPLFSCQ